MQFNSIYSIISGFKIGKDNKEVHKQIIELIKEDFGDINKVKQDFIKKVSIVNSTKDLDGFNPVPNKPKFLSEAEILEKRKNHQAALDILSKTIATQVTIGKFCPNSVCITKNGKQYAYNRGTQSFLKPFNEDLTPEELIEYNNKLETMTPVEKKEFIDNKLDEIEKFIEDISTAKTDNEFLKVIKGRAMLLNCIGEFEYSKNMYSDLCNYVGENISEQFKNRMDNIRKKGLSLTDLTNRLSYIADPHTTFLKNPLDATNYAKWIEENSNALKKSNDKELNKLVESEKRPNSIDECNKHKEKFGNYISPLFMIGEDENNLEWVDVLIDQYLVILKSKLGEDNVSFYNLEGNKLDDEQTRETLKQGKIINAYDGNRFLQTVELENDWGFVTPEKDIKAFDYYNTNNSKYSINQYLSNFKEQLEAGNPWYMKLRNAVIPGPYNKMINKIDSIINKKEVKPEELKEAFEYIANNAQEYLKGKENDNKSRTDLTNKRIQAAKGILNVFKYSIGMNEQAKEIIESATQNYEKEKNKIKERMLENAEKVELELDGLEIKETKADKFKKLDDLYKKENPNIKAEELKEYHSLLEDDIENYSKIETIKMMSDKRKEIKDIVVSMNPNMNYKYIFKQLGSDESKLNQEIESLYKHKEDPTSVVKPININNVEMDLDIEEYKFTDDLDGKTREKEIPVKEFKKDDELVHNK